jgi:hypothetical protein
MLARHDALVLFARLLQLDGMHRLWQRNRRRLNMTGRTVLLISAVLVIGAVLYTGSYRRQVHAQAAHGAFTVELETRNLDQPGGMVTERRTIARRTDGTEAWQSTYPTHPEIGAMGKVVHSDGTMLVMVHAAQAIQTGRETADALKMRMERLTNHPADCAYPGEHVVRGDTIEGVHVYQITNPSAATHQQPVLVTEWRAPELGCQTLRAIGVKRTPEGGGYVPYWETRVVPGSLKTSEPDSHWFAQPAGYHEMPPGEVRHTLEHSMHAQACAECASQDAAEDDAYMRSHGRLQH